jgi:hypothetical protein
VIAKGVPARGGTRTFATGIAYVQKHEHRRHPALVGVGVSFDDRVSYASAEEKAAWTHTRGVSTLETAAAEMEALARFSTRCADPVQHEILAYAKHEHPTREQMVADVERLLTALDMADHQYVMSVHTDTDDLHAHVIVNRVGEDGRANQRWNERIIRERTCAQIAAERGWGIVVGFHNRDIVQEHLGLDAMPLEPQRRVFDGNFNRVYERGELPWQDAARPYVFEAVERATSWDDLRARLDTHGVVLKAVEREGRLAGLAFAEGLAADAPGCAASRIDARCKLSALEARFGPYVSPEGVTRSGPEPAAVDPQKKPVLWHEQMRPGIVAAVDAARSWDDLRVRLGAVGVVLKAVERGGRFQGFAFAAGESVDAPGCGASRIDDRCKRSTLEARFGPFPLAAHEPQRSVERPGASTREEARVSRSHPETGVSDAVRGAGRTFDTPSSAKSPPREEARESVRARVEFDSTRNGEWALERALGIADNARLRGAYRQFCDRFYQERREGWRARRDAAWNGKSAQRRLESQRRWEAKQMQRGAVRFLTPPGGVRRFAYDLVEKLHTLRGKHERRRAAARWEGVKADLTARLGKERTAKPVRYRDFVAGRVQEGDAGARRVLAYLDRRGYLGMAGEPVVERDVRRGEFVVELAAVERKLVERSAAIEREKRRIVIRPEPAPLEYQIAQAREAVLTAARDRAAALTVEEAQRLDDIERRRRHWNPLVRMQAGKEERAIMTGRDARVHHALDKAEWAFEERQISRLTTVYHTACEERRAGKMLLVRLDEEQRGIGRDLRTVESLRKEMEAVEERDGKLPSLDRSRFREEPRKRFADLRAAWKTARGRGRSREEQERENGLGLEMD